MQYLTDITIYKTYHRNLEYISLNRMLYKQLKREKPGYIGFKNILTNTIKWKKENYYLALAAKVRGLPLFR